MQPSFGPLPPLSHVPPSLPYLITASTTWLYQLGMVSPAVNFALMDKVDQVYEQLVAVVAGEASRVPALLCCTKHSNVSHFKCLTTPAASLKKGQQMAEYLVMTDGHVSHSINAPSPTHPVLLN